QSRCNHPICKGNAVLDAAARYGINPENIIAVGDGENDICMIKNAGVGIAFCSTNKMLKTIADFEINEKSFSSLLKITE
ncbi:MAG TPA: HAD hydrolase family protein, partial [Candidatus Wallbacteria bacterium]|nr:HAD hydrolase family protein [Candidatus Wallbacteria bacterium]